ncbi:cilium assembly protein DZIP1L [Chironomus tepperi]|uniref:cilium assembly protein DZIP1L n=1 Tax=Chironomus tepperi TaxID=113505 RepID=UPI00391F05E4
MSYNFYHNLAEIARNGGFVLSNENNDGSDVRIDWRFIAAIDTHRVIKESNFEKLDECIPFLINSSLSNLLNTRILDPAIGKIFTLSQLSIQYLLFCTRFLDKSVSTLRENLYSCQKETLDLQEKLKERNTELHQAKKKAKKLESNPLEIYPCTKCTKNFESQLFLDSHMLRKHRESKDQDLINTIKLELELKQVKEKLNLTEKELMDSKNVTCEKCLENERRIFKNIGIQSNFEEKEKDDLEKENTSEKFRDYSENIREMMAEQMKQFQEYKEYDERRHKEEISELKDMLDKAMETLKQNEIKRAEQPLPAPRSTVPLQQSFAPPKPKEVKVVPPQSDNENLWKTRFKELEKMYEHNQLQMAQSMKDMEKTYAEKLNKLEDSMKQLKDESAKINQVPITPVPRTVQKEVVPRVLIRKPKETSSSSDEDVSEDPKPIKQVRPVLDTLPKNIPQQPLHLSTYSDQKFSIREKKKKTFSAQKWFNRDKSQQKPKEVPVKDRVKAEQLLNDRLKEFNIDEHTEQLNENKVDLIEVELANRREIQKKTYPHFFINRKKIKQKVEELFKSHVQDTEKEESISVKKDPVILKDEDPVKLKDENPVDEKPKKKVLFNLDEDYKSNVHIKSNEDSDFDLTSLEDDFK